VSKDPEITYETWMAHVEAGGSLDDLLPRVSEDLPAAEQIEALERQDAVLRGLIAGASDEAERLARDAHERRSSGPGWFTN